MENNKKSEFIRIVKFILFSISAGIIQIVSFTLLNEILHWPYWVSYLIALVLSVIWNFTFNRKFTFKSANNVPVAMLLVLAYYAVFTPLSTLLENYLTSIGWNEYLVTAINMALNFVTEFLYQRFVVFGKTINTNDVAKKDEEKAKAKLEKKMNSNLSSQINENKTDLENSEINQENSPNSVETEDKE